MSSQDQDVLPPLPKVHQIYLCYGVCLLQGVGFKTHTLREYKEVDSGTMGSTLMVCLLALAELPLKAVNSSHFRAGCSRANDWVSVTGKEENQTTHSAQLNSIQLNSSI